MRNTTRIVLFAPLFALSACGGGSDTKDLTCSDFRYQEDAQSAYNQGARQLDGDNDGIACESLPRRPVPPPPPPPPPAPPPATVLPTPSAYLLSSQGTLFRYAPLQSGFTLDFASASINGGSGGPLYPRTAPGGGIEFSVGSFSFRIAATTQGLVTWTPAQVGLPAGVGFAVPASDAASLTQLVGTYRLLGQRCAVSGSPCTMATATLRIHSSGTLEMCPDAELSPTCPGRVEEPSMLAWPRQAPGGANAWLYGYGRILLLGSSRLGTLGIAGETVVYVNGSPMTTSHYAFFGQRDELTLPAVQFFPVMTAYSISGLVTQSIPTAASWAVASNRPRQGYFQDASGNTYMRSTSGQVTSWSNSEGLRVYIQ